MEEKSMVEEKAIEYFDYLTQEYKLPPCNLNLHEWQVYTDTIYKHLENHDRVYDYDGALHIVILRAAHITQKEESKFFTLNYLIKALDDLPCFGIYTDEIAKMKDEIRKRTNYGQEIMFEKVKNKKIV